VTRGKWFLLVLVAVLLLVSILAMFMPSTPAMPSPGVPESWKRHKELFGRFEMWLPEGWEEMGYIRTTIHNLREVAEGGESPLLFSASGDRLHGFYQWVEVVGYDTAFEFYAPLVGEELAQECSRRHPVALTRESVEPVYLDDSNIVIIELDEGQSIVAYQSEVLGQSLDSNLVRTVGCVVSTNHVYQIYMDVVEENEGTNVPIHETILKAFRVLK